MGKALSAAVIVTIVVGAAIGFMFFTQLPANQVFGKTLTVDVSVRNRYTGTQVDTVTVAWLYLDETGNWKQKDSVATASSSGAVSNEAFTSGDQYVVKLSASGYITRFIEWTVPYAVSDYVSYHYASFDIWDTGTWAITVENENGTRLDASTDFDASWSGADDTPTWDVMIKNSEDDSGFCRSYDVSESTGEWDLEVFYVRISGTDSEGIVFKDASLFQAAFISATDRYYVLNLPAQATDLDLLDSGQYSLNADGTWSMKLSFDLSAVNSNTSDITFGHYYYTSAEYRVANNGWGADATAGASAVTLDITAAT